MTDVEAPRHEPASEFLAPEIFSGLHMGFHIIGSNLAITFGNPRWDYSQNPARLYGATVARVIMPVPAAHELAVQIFNFLEQNGLSPPKPGGSGVQ